MGMSQEIRADYAHMDLLPQSLEDWVAPDRPARCIWEFVDALDLKELGFQLRESTVHGARAAPSENAVVASLHGLQLVQIARPVDQGKSCNFTGPHLPLRKPVSRPPTRHGRP